MPASVPLRRDFDARHLVNSPAVAPDARQSRRLLSLAAVYDGMSRERPQGSVGWIAKP